MPSTAEILAERWTHAEGRRGDMLLRAAIAEGRPAQSVGAELQAEGLLHADELPESADLRGIPWKGLDLRALVDGHLVGPTLSGVHLEGADLSAANVERGHFVGAILDGAAASGLQGMEADFHRASARGCDFALAQLLGAKFVAAHLEGAQFSGADLRDADFTGATASGASFANVNLRDAVMLRADLGGANFSGARLDKVDFRKANVLDADWTDCVPVDLIVDRETCIGAKIRCELDGDYDQAVVMYCAFKEAYRRAGLRRHADGVYYRESICYRKILREEMRRARLWRWPDKFAAWFWMWILFLFVGHGEGPGRAFLWVLVFTAAYVLIHYGYGDLLPEWVDTIAAWFSRVAAGMFAATIMRQIIRN